MREFNFSRKSYINFAWRLFADSEKWIALTVDLSSDLKEEEIFINGAEFDDLITVVSDFHSAGVTCGDVTLCFSGAIIPRSNASISTSTIITIPQEFTFTDLIWVNPNTLTGNYTQTTDPAGNTVLEVSSPSTQYSYLTYGFNVNINVPSTIGCGLIIH